MINKLMKFFIKEKKVIKTMAKAPKVGSRLAVAKYGFEKVLKKDKQYKVIQPMILSYHDDTFFWSCKVISIGKTSSVGIARKSEEGFIIILERAGKFKTLLKVLKDKVSMLPVVAETKVANV